MVHYDVPPFRSLRQGRQGKNQLAGHVDRFLLESDERTLTRLGVEPSGIVTTHVDDSDLLASLGRNVDVAGARARSRRYVHQQVRGIAAVRSARPRLRVCVHRQPRRGHALLLSRLLPCLLHGKHRGFSRVVRRDVVACLSWARLRFFYFFISGASRIIPFRILCFIMELLSAKLVPSCCLWSSWRCITGVSIRRRT